MGEDEHLHGQLSSWDLNFKVGIQDSLFIKSGIQDSNLNPRKMAGIQDSDLVFKGPIVNTSYPRCPGNHFKSYF